MTGVNRYNVNLAFGQGGDNIHLGAVADRLRSFTYEDLARALQALNPDYISVFDDFLGDTLLDEWDVDSGTAAVTGTGNGIATLTTGTTTGDHCTLALGLHWALGDWLVFEARIASDTAITARDIEVGLSDAVSETNGLAFSSHDATPVDVATDAVVFALDASESVVTWSCLSVNDGTPARTDSAVAHVAGTYQTLRIEIDADGNAVFSINGTVVATHLLAVAEAAVLTPWLTIVTEADAAKVLDIDYVSVVGPRA